ncbi:deoxyribodipyrimidine photo-lyase [Halieaceae bacterium IMCC8485]|uniref:Deoxyribodipyrimidine photo-lyase n=1 Tax=Candidatus Seongchinamella marina TaxID=2518990 RepID=A0ABT3SWD3_9GAMM|nr:deoxyribodipyrimidine photo-lyase [Candidatus Seongchinamella marina]MCX2974308.1 deoxyribodipyrimidine photo-lyase [Candidatus Seongchinamella marina]
MSLTDPVIYWFRRDLRLTDLPGLQAALASGKPVIPCFILDDESTEEWAMGGASRWWLHHSLQALTKSVAEQGGNLLVRRGDTQAQLNALVNETGAAAVYCSELYEPDARDLEKTLGEELAKSGAAIHCLPGTLFFRPHEVRNGSGLPFKVFTPFWRHCMQRLPSMPLPQKTIFTPNSFLQHSLTGLSCEQWQLLPDSPNWAADWHNYWTPGEAGATETLKQFVTNTLADYAQGRDFPARDASSRLSAHFHWGEISPRQAWAAVNKAPGSNDKDQHKFLSELGWRDFNHHLLFHFPHIADRPFKPSFSQMPWQGSDETFKAWCEGRTGYPIVDAGMRELWQTGFMHNRVRMICASFLTKHLLLPWQWGARWFWDTLVDADLANNSGGWQWVAGCGADASPWFRIFNPMLQGKKFDGDGEYVRRWLPELAGLSDRDLQIPWEAPPLVLADAGVTLGSDYPFPIVDHKDARAAALAAYDAVSKASS